MRSMFFAALVGVALLATARTTIASTSPTKQVAPSGAPTVFTSPLPSPTAT